MISLLESDSRIGVLLSLAKVATIFVRCHDSNIMSRYSSPDVATLI